MGPVESSLLTKPRFNAKITTAIAKSGGQGNESQLPPAGLARIKQESEMDTSRVVDLIFFVAQTSPDAVGQDAEGKTVNGAHKPNAGIAHVKASIVS
jgi:hypothetical protein